METSHPTKRPPAGLEAHLGYWMRLVSNHVSGQFARSLQQHQLSTAEWVVLRLGYDQDTTSPSDLAQATGMTRGAISKIVDKLESKGWMSRAIEPHDRRVQRLVLTPAGRQLVPTLAGIADSNDRTFFECLTKTEQAELARLLQKMARAHSWSDVPTE